jgi:integrase
LIASLPRKLSIFTRVVKETGARSGEIWSLTWEDVDFERNIIQINYPEKGSRARSIKVNGQTISVLSRLPRNSRFVFRSSPENKLKNFLSYFIRKKKQIAPKLCNPILKAITWRSLRHFKGTMEYHKTKDILYVKELLGHVNIQNTLVYTHLVNWDTDDFICKVAKTLDEVVNLIESGFEYVCSQQDLLFRKRK